MRLILLSFILVACSSTQPNPSVSAPADFESSIQQNSFLPQADYESPSLLKLDQVLDPTLFESDIYRIDEVVVNNGYMNLYRIRSDYGLYEVVSTEHLKIRLHEIAVLNALDKLSLSQLLLDKSKDLGVRTIMVPLDNLKYSTALIVHPDKLYTTLKQLPGGVTRIFAFAERSLSGAFNGVESDQEKTPSVDHQPESASSLAGEVVGLSRKYLDDRLGRSKNMQDWLHYYEIDPFTSNQLVLSRIRALANIESAIDLGFSFLPSLPAVASLSISREINSYYAKVEDIALYAPANQRKSSKIEVLRSFGQEEEEIDNFFTTPQLTPTSQNIIIDTLQSLTEVSNRDALLDAAVKIHSEAGRLFFTRLALNLQSYHQKETPLISLIDGTSFPAAVSNKDELVIFLPVDYLIWGEHFDNELQTLQNRAAERFTLRSVRLLVSGEVSEQLASKMREKGVQVEVRREFL